MNSLVKSLIQPILEQEGQNIALVPGGFKPPTMGHFYLVDEVAKDSNIDKVIVLIGHKNRDGVSKEESKAVWNIYKKYLPSNVEIQIADNSSPIADVASIIKNNPQNTYYPVVGIRGEMDLGDLKRFDSLKDKYDNFQTIVIKSEGEDRISGTNTRAALIGREKERFQSYLPTELSDEEKEEVWSILQKTPVDEGTCGYNTDVNTGEKLDTPGGIEEMYAEPSKFSYPPMIKSLTEYMLDKGMNIRPLPKVKFVNDDVENARDFFGKTAYYNPNERVIVLYTMNRHPKDVMRSYAHEMIHHMQNCDGRLGGITTQNTNEEGDLPEIEREAYEKGNMTFRNWTDTLTEGVFGNKIVCDNCRWSWKIADGGDDLYICHKCGHDNTPMSLNEGRYDKISNQISSTIFKQWREDINNGAEASRLQQYFPFGDEEISIDANISVIPGLGKLNVDGGADDEEDYIEVRFEIDPTFLPKFWEEISMNLKDVIRHELEHLTHGEGFTSNPGKIMDDDMFIRQMIDMKMLPRADYFKLEKEIDANLQGMYFRAKKEKRPFGDVINMYLDAQDITPEQKEEIMNLWRRRLPALNLPKF
jgi:nicotinic acid mononucleotide adenylyltransferase